jgi:hypothetical protein
MMLSDAIRPPARRRAADRRELIGAGDDDRRGDLAGLDNRVRLMADCRPV